MRDPLATTAPGLAKVQAGGLWAAACARGGGAGWAAAAAAGWLLGTALFVAPGGLNPAGLAAGAVQGGLAGLGLGVAQALALRWWLRRQLRFAGALVADWPWVTVAGGALGAAAGEVLGSSLAGIPAVAGITL